MAAIMAAEQVIRRMGTRGVHAQGTNAMTDKVQSRTLRVGLYTKDGKLISNQHEVIMDRTSDNPRDREEKVQLVLSREADDANGHEVILKLEEPVAGTSHFKEYKSLRYLMRRSFSSDFDL